MTAEQLATIADESEERTPLPAGWRLVRLGDVCDVQLGKMLSPTSRTGKRSRHYLRNANVQWNRFDLSDIAEMDFSEVEEKKFILEYGDLLVCEGGEPGRAAVWEEQIKPCFYQKALHRVRPLNHAVDSKFLMYRLWLGAANGEFIDSHAQTTIAHLPAVRLLELNLAVPKIEEQRRIATVLDEQMKAVERARRAVEEQIEAAKLLPGALFSEAFHGITPLTIDPLEQDAPEGWRWETLRNLARLESGHTPSRYHPEWWGGDIPWLALPDIRNLDGKTAFETIEYTNELGIANSSARILPAGTVCLSRTASVGFVTVMGRPMATSQDFVNWVCGEQLDPYFLSFILQASRDYLLSLATGAVHKTIYVPTVKDFRICLPDLPEQKRIAERLAERTQAVENLKESLVEQLEAIGKMPAALLRKAFAGEV
jgi:type I restriction enzyme, S subunit